MASVRVENLVKRYGSVTALKSVSAEIPDGSFTAILGPSGCGKTTLLRCIAGLLIPEEGAVYIGAADVTRTEPYRRNLGMVFQRPSMFPHMTVFQNIAWALKLRGWQKDTIPARVEEMLRLVQLEGLANRRYAQLSGGQAQRVVIARALAPNPDLLLLDEPLSALDAKLRAELLVHIGEIQRQTRCTTLLVTHDQSEALTAADNLIVMQAGEIVQQGSPLEVYRHPKNLFSASFIGTSNLLPCAVTANGGGHLELTLEAAALTLVVEAPQADYQVGQRVWACVRADDIDLLIDESQSAAPNVVLLNINRVMLTGGFVRVEGCIDRYPISLHVGGSARFRLLEDSSRQFLCRLGHITVVPRDDEA